ncbi:MAG: hypothetical protein Q9191_003679 [Dirinaria sp. TL-2023a]
MSDGAVHLDGTTLEGGGQLLRLALSLSSLTHIPIHVTNIRGKRGSLSAPGEAGGLKASHLAAVKWLADATNASTDGAAVKSSDLMFSPSERVHGLPGADPLPIGKDLVRRRRGAGEIQWHDRYDGNVLVRKESFIPASTPGSIFLVFQAILPYLLFSAPVDLKASKAELHEPVCHKLIVEGGTNVSKAPSYEYASQVLLPMLEKVGIPPIKISLDKRGWSHGRAQVGRVNFEITPLGQALTLPAFSLTNRGSVVRFLVSILAPDEDSRRSISKLATGKILKSYPDAEILFPVDEDSKHPKRLYLHIVAETSGGFRLGRDWMYDRKSAASSPQQKTEQLVEKVMDDLERELAHGGCVDEYMQDQLVVFQALTQGRSEIDYGKDREVSLHTQTARWVSREILGSDFDTRGLCEGVGFKVGEEYREGSKKGEVGLAKNMKRLNIKGQN